MQITQLPRVGLPAQDQSRWAQRSATPARLFGLLMIAIGIGGWWYNWHLAATAGHFYIKLCILGPLGIFGGLLMALRPQWAGPLRTDSTRAHKAALFTAMGAMFLVSGIDFYLLMNGRPPAVVHSPAKAGAPDITFLGRTYRLASFNRKQNPTWEFVTAGERVDDWKTLLTIVDRPDARTREDLDRLAEGIMSTYKSRGGQILMAKTMGRPGSVYNYMVAAFEEPARRRFELNFVKMSLGANNATVAIYGVRITDPRDYLAKAKAFLDQKSGEVGRELERATLPEAGKLPQP